VPLGHYMVLGSANSVSEEISPRQARLEQLREQQEREQQEEAERARAEVGGGRGGGGFGEGYGGGRGFDGGRDRFEGAATESAPTYATSHFAVVVQVVEGESFQGDE